MEMSKKQYFSGTIKGKIIIYVVISTIVLLLLRV